MSSKFYWLKLDKDFFKRHDIKIIEAMPNGKDYILFYLKLLCESIDHNGNLRFNDNIPYNEDMLATITNTNVDIVRNAINVFSTLGMIEILDDGTYYMNAVQKMLGSECESAERVRKYRANIKMLQCNGDVTKSNIDIDIDKELDKDIKKWKKPTVDEIKEYCKERNNGIDANTFYDFYESKNWFVGKNKMKDWKACVRTWEKRNNGNKKEMKKPDWYDDYNNELSNKLRYNHKNEKPLSQEEIEQALKEAKDLFGE